MTNGTIDRLIDHPASFDFFQAVRLLQRAGAGVHTPIGYDGPPGEEAVRFTSLVSLAFPPDAVVAVKPSAARNTGADGAPPANAIEPPPGGPFTMTVAFMGLLGAIGVLPHHYTSQALANARDRNTGLHDFLDLFNHRIVSFFYRAHNKYRFPIEYERFATEEHCQDRLKSESGEEADDRTDKRADPITELFFSLIGLGSQSLRERLGIDDQVLLLYGGLLAHSARSAAGLEGMLSDYFDLPVQVASFHGQWLQLSADSRSCLPRRGEEPRNVAVGSTLVLGDRIWDVQSKFLVKLGPLDYDRFKQFLPGQPAYREIFQLIRFYVGSELDFDLQPVLLANKVPECALGKTSGGHWLGQNTWLRTKPYPRDFNDALFTSADM